MARLIEAELSAPRAMYDLDLWAVVPAETTISYRDGTSVTVPAGPLAGAIGDLKRRDPKPIVVCQVRGSSMY